MVSKKPKLPRLHSPRGTAVFPWLTKPDTQFDAEGVFKTGLRLDPADSKVQKLIAELDAFAEGHKKELKLAPAKAKKYNMPYKNEVDDDGDETGMIIVNFKTKATLADGTAKKLKIFDASGQPYSGGPIYGGSQIKVNFSPNGYKSGVNIGTNLYLNAVQVLELVTGDGGSAESYGFEAEEGYTNPANEDDNGEEF